MALTVDQLRSFDSNWGNLVVQQGNNDTKVKAGGLRHALGSLFHMSAAQARNRATYTAIRNAIMQDDRFFGDDVKSKADELLKGLDNGSRIKASTIKSIISQLDAMSTPEKQIESVRKSAIARLAASGIPGNIPASIQEKYKELAADFVAFRSDANASMGSINVGQRLTDFNQMMQGFFNGFGADAAATEIFCKTLNNYATGDGAVSLGPADKLQTFADTVRANLQELDEIGNSRGDAIRNSLVSTLKRTGALRPDVMTALVDRGAALPKCGLELLTGQSDAGAIHRAISKMADAMDKARSEFKPSETRGLDENEIGACLVKSAMVRFPPNARRELLAALESNDGKNLLGFYAQHAADPKAQRMNLVFSSLVAHLRAEFNGTDPGATVAAPNVNAATLPPEAICEFATGVDDVVTGAATQQIKDYALSASGIDAAADPGAELKGRMNAIAKGLVTKSIVMRMDSLRAGELGAKNGPPDLDLRLESEDYLEEGMNVFGTDFVKIHLADGTVLSPTSAAEARDALVKFITDNPAAHYDEHMNADLKTKVNILMESMTASTLFDMNTSFGAAFEPEGKRRVINPYGTISKEQHVFSKDENGTINVSHSLRMDKPILPMINKETGSPWAFSGDANSYFETSMQVTYPADNFNALARADWSQLDSTDVLKAVDGGPGDKAPHRYEKIPESVSDAYRFTGDVSMSFSLHVDALQPNSMESDQFVRRWHRHEDPV